MAASPPAVSVVMPVLDPKPEYLRSAVQSVLGQSFADLELIIIEDPSSLHAADILAGIHDPRLKVYSNARRTSLVEQRNTGLQIARGELIACLDSDDIAEPHRMGSQVAYMQANEGISVLGSQLRIIDGRGSVIGYRCYPQAHAQIVAAMRIYNPIAQPAVMFRAKQVREHNGYNRSAEDLLEDYDLWCRLAKAGIRFATHPDPLTRYRIHASGMKTIRLRSMLRATITVKRKYWHENFGVRGSIRLALEYMLLFVPERMVTRLFRATQIQARPCRLRSHGGDGL